MLFRLLVTALLCGGLVTPLFGQTPEAKTVADLIKKMTSYKLAPEDEQPALIPKPLQDTFIRLKQMLPALVQVNMNPAGKAVFDPVVMKDNLINDLKPTGVKLVRSTYPAKERTLFGPFPVKDDSQPPTFSLVDVFFEPIKGHDDLMVVRVTMLVVCGWDESLYVFKFEHGSWKLILAQQGIKNEKPHYLQENLSYMVVESNIKDDLVIVTTFSPPWCTSNWGELDITVQRPGVDPFKPVVLKRISESFVRTDLYVLNSWKEKFSVLYISSDKDSPGDRLIHYDEYVLRGGKVKRIVRETYPGMEIAPIVRIYYQEKKFERKVNQIRDLLAEAGYEVSEKLQETYYNPEWINTIRCFYHQDQGYAFMAQKGISKIMPMELLDLTDEFKNVKIKPGSIEIWICDKEHNETLKKPSQHTGRRL